MLRTYSSSFPFFRSISAGFSILDSGSWIRESFDSTEILSINQGYNHHPFCARKVADFFECKCIENNRSPLIYCDQIYFLLGKLPGATSHSMEVVLDPLLTTFFSIPFLSKNNYNFEFRPAAFTFNYTDQGTANRFHRMTVLLLAAHIGAN
jgi:hypothetical protein